MNHKFDFDKIGKRLPYTMPSGTFDEMEANIMAALKQDKPRKRLHRMMRWGTIGALATAASVAILLTIAPTRKMQNDALAQIDQAYNNLSEADQDYLIDIYQEDIFLTQE